MKIKNSDTDEYATLKFDIYLDGIDLNELRNMRQKELELNLRVKR